MSNQLEWDAVNFEFGQHVDFGDRKKIRFHGGLQYARIKQDVDRSNFFSIGTSDNDLKYTGIGPRTGLDMSYDVGNGFAIYANGAAAVLVGKSKFNDSFTLASTGGTFITSGSKTAIVPELEAKLGLKYFYPMAQGDLTLDAGWMWVNYFDVHHTAPLFVSNFSETDVGLQGPYVGLKWVGNA